MKSTELIRWALEMTRDGTQRLVADMRDAALTRSTPGNGNHAVWTLGHLCYLEGGMRHVLLGEENPVENWANLFAPGTKPTDDAAMYPSFEELLRKYKEFRAYNLQLLERIGEAGLDRAPEKVPPGFESVMTSLGQTLLLIALHNMVHYGEIADARRMAGKKPLM